MTKQTTTGHTMNKRNQKKGANPVKAAFANVIKFAISNIDAANAHYYAALIGDRKKPTEARRDNQIAPPRRKLKGGII